MDPRSFAAALDAASAAGPGPVEPALVFNRALALEFLGLAPEARAEFERLAATDPDPQWAAEAKGRAIRLGQALDTVRAARPGGIIGRALSEILPTWAEAVRSGDAARANEALRDLREAADDLEAASGDTSLSDVAAVIFSSQADQEALAAGIGAYERGEYEFAAKRFRQMPMLLGWSRYRVATTRYLESHYEESLVELARVRHDFEGSKHVVLLGRVLYQEALIHGVLGDHSVAIAIAQRATPLLEASGDLATLSRSQELLAHESLVLGQRRAAWRAVHRALLLSTQAAEATSTYTALGTMVSLARDERLPGAELALAEAYVRQAQEIGDPVALAPALKERARALWRLGQRSTAIADLERAFELAASIDNSSVRKLVDGDLLFARGEVLSKADPRASEDDLTKAIEIYRDTDYLLYYPRALRLRATVRSTEASSSEAIADYDEALSEIERQRGKVSDAPTRIAFYDEAREIFGEQVELLVKEGEWDRALARSEQARGRALLDELIGQDHVRGDEIDPARWARDLPYEVRVVSYFLGPEHVYAWVGSRNGFAGIDLGPIRRSLEGDVLRFRHALESGARRAFVNGVLAELRDQLVAPLESLIQGATRLVVIPDGVLHQIPFSSLYDTPSDSYLFERFEVVLAASLRLAGRGAERAPAPSAGVLVVAAGAPDRYPALPGAAREARGVAALYPGSVLWTPETPLDLGEPGSLGSFKMLHFAGHARTDALEPDFNGLFLDRTRFWSLAEIARADLSRLDLAVLSACGTARGPVSRSEGARSLARSFLTAGARAVISSLWDVNDSATARFARTLHLGLVEGLSPAGALGMAKRNAAREGLPFTTWASFELYGYEAPAAENLKNIGG